MNETPASVENFDLSRHAVVEASAGTGKTYTIENLVLRLLTEEDVPLEQILLVTFTEKATGDLKTRLRIALERAAQRSDDDAARYATALSQFDQAPVFTIHGFCQRLAQEYALEQGQDFRLGLADDPDLLRMLLREIQRKDWRKHFGPRLRAVLETANYSRETAEDFDKKILEIASRCKPRAGHQLRPTFVLDWWQRLDEAGANWTGQLEIFTIHALHERLRDYKRQHGFQSFDDMIADVEECLDPARNPDAERFAKVLRQRYRYGIVDEFQDTDPLQWRIFRRIFLDGRESKLFIVGDPKQAIFGFRGADLPTYLHAANEMTGRFSACAYPLQINWRSDPDLLDGLNCLFQDGEWFPQASGIRYLPVHAPDDDKRQTRIEEDHTDRPALMMVDLGDAPTMKLAQKQFARFIVHEIQRLLNDRDGPRLTFAHKSLTARPIHAGDFCILIMKRPDANPIVQALDFAGIPYSFYKQTGLWHSDEANHVEILLQTLVRSDDAASFRKALLTCFFRIKPTDLARCPDVPMQHPARQLYQSWLACAEERRWSALFRSLLEDTGLLFHDTDQPDADRRLTNLRQILSTLEQVGHGFNFDLVGMLDWIVQRRNQRDSGETDMQPVDLNRPRVKIMTIHSSKGLEFPIVFMAGGFTQGNQIGTTIYRDDKQRSVFDLCPDNDARERVSAELLSEQRRLLYVALTRPIFKLYVPKVKIPQRRQWVGPAGTILLSALEKACPDKLGPLVAEIIKPAPALVLTKPESDAVSEAQPLHPIQINGPLFPVIDQGLGKRRIVVRSFSSMTRHHLSQVGEGESFGAALPRGDEDAAPLAERDDPLRGPVFGDMVHNVLERIDFAEVARTEQPDELIVAGARARTLMDAEIRANVGKLRTRTPREKLEDACRTQIAALVWHSLRTPLACVGSPLCAIPTRDRLHEIEFQYPEHAGAAVASDVRAEDGFITGFMDLLFRARERYYLVDFKTNLLAAYGPAQIERSMDESDYHRQYQLYLQAVLRWLRRVHGPQFAFEKHFGGVYYLYVRGMNGRDETTGVFFHAPTKQDLDLKHVLNG